MSKVSFELFVINKATTKKTIAETLIRKQVNSTELMDKLYLQHNSLIGSRNRENYIKNTIWYFIKNSTRIKDNKLKVFVVFQSKMNELQDSDFHSLG